MQDVAWRVNAERLVVLGWGRAILLQLAHPLIAAGVADHSTFREGPRAAAGRLYHTIAAMLALTFGDAEAFRQTVETIRTIHRRVHGVLRSGVGPFPAGTPYSAEDPRLLLWVHVTLIESVMLVYQDLVGPLDEAERNQYCREASRVPIALGAYDADVPRTWRSVQRSLAATRESGVVVVGPDARALAAAVLSPPYSAVAWPVVLANRTLTIGRLPADVRTQYGWLWTREDARRDERIRRVLRAVRQRTPRGLAWWRVARAVSPVAASGRGGGPGRLMGV